MSDLAQVYAFPVKHDQAGRPLEQLRDKKQIAAHFSVTTSTVDRWVLKGMPYVDGTRRRFRASECEAWYQHQRA